MKKFLVVFVLTLGLFQTTEASLNKTPDGEILLITIPKSGTNLMIRFLQLITGKNYGFEAQFINLDWSYTEFQKCMDNHMYPKGKYPALHFNLSSHAKRYLAAHPEMKAIVMIRDPRDVCISATYFFSEYLSNQIGKEASFDERLLWLITEGSFESARHVSNQAIHLAGALEWLGDPRCLIVKFEDLIGPRGKGSIERQIETLRNLCSYIGVELSEKEEELVLNSFWGNTQTFRKGQIGSWRDQFKPEHIAAFKEYLGPYLIALGYEEDENW